MPGSNGLGILSIFEKAVSWDLSLVEASWDLNLGEASWDVNLGEASWGGGARWFFFWHLYLYKTVLAELELFE